MTFVNVQGRCPACSGSSLFLGEGGHVTCSRSDCPSPTAVDNLLHRQTIGQWPGSRCEITIDVFTSGSKRQVRRITPLHDDMAITRVLLAEELRQLADGIERLGLEATGGQS
jgi:hypothetical protein